jgi:hypothetical protein
MGKTSGRPRLEGRPGANSQLKTYGRVSGTHRVLSERFLSKAAFDQDRTDAMAALGKDAERALDLLERGLAAYAIADVPTAPAEQPSVGDT